MKQELLKDFERCGRKLLYKMASRKAYKLFESIFKNGFDQEITGGTRS